MPLPPPLPESAGREVLLRLRDVGRTFQMGEVSVVALKTFTLDVYQGELLVLLGPSGSGKTTILNLLGGLDQASAGEIWYRDEELTHATPKQLTSYRR